MVQKVRTTTRHRRAARTSLGDLVSPADPVYLGSLPLVSRLSRDNDIGLARATRFSLNLVNGTSWSSRLISQGKLTSRISHVYMISICVCARVRMYACTYKTGSQGRIRSPIMDSFRSSSFPRSLAASGQGERQGFTFVDLGTRAIARIARTSLWSLSSVTERRV